MHPITILFLIVAGIIAALNASSYREPAGWYGALFALGIAVVWEVLWRRNARKRSGL